MPAITNKNNTGRIHFLLDDFRLGVLKFKLSFDVSFSNEESYHLHILQLHQ